MTVRDPDRLFELLPAVYGEHDAAVGHQLRALLRIVGRQAAALEADVEQLYDDLFIETCRPWVIPYIGDLVSNDLLYDAGRLHEPHTGARLFTDLAGPDLRPPLAIRTRADVAKTIYYRRRKGTPPMLEELARDVTGWPTHAVEFLELLGWTQFLEHFRAQSGWFDVRSVERDQRVDGPFDEASHTVDVRRVAQSEGRHSVRNVGFFVWRLGSYPLARVPARQASEPWRFHFSPLGNRAALFAHWRREGDERGLATELHVPGPLRRAFFARHIPDVYGALQPASIFVERNGVPVDAAAIVCGRLDPWPANPPSKPVIAVDVEAGRLAIGTGMGEATDALDVSFHYGFPTDLGGGPYERRRWLLADGAWPGLVRYRVKENGVTPPGTPPVTHTSVAAALAEWSSAAAGRPNAVITILDSRTYALPGAIALSGGDRIAIEADNFQRPLLRTPATGLIVQADATPPADPDLRGGLTLSGVAVEGFLHVAGDVGRLRLLHTTVVPGRRLTEDGEPEGTAPSVVVEGANSDGAPINGSFRLEAAFSILGPVVVPRHAEGARLLDTIVDGLGGAAIVGPAGTAGAPLELERCTVLGDVRAHSLSASESIFTAPVVIDHTQRGCVRFSYVPHKSRTPRRHRCQPDLAIRAALDAALAQDPALATAQRDAVREAVAGRIRPSFTSLRYGAPAYCQLRVAAPEEIRSGAEDGSEMGVLCHVKQRQRESNLRIRLEEYLPFGLEAGVIYVN